MAINIKRVSGHILDRGDFDKPHQLLYGQQHNRYFRFIFVHHTRPLWYHIHDDGELGGLVYKDTELEELFQESNGFLEQLELF